MQLIPYWGYIQVIMIILGVVIAISPIIIIIQLSTISSLLRTILRRLPQPPRP